MDVMERTRSSTTLRKGLDLRGERWGRRTRMERIRRGERKLKFCGRRFRDGIVLINVQQAYTVEHLQEGQTLEKLHSASCQGTSLLHRQKRSRSTLYLDLPFHHRVSNGKER